jgi:shikimate kinase
MSGPYLVLVGPPGAGKTTVGRLLAARLGLSLRDTDDDIEAAVGKPISDIFLDEGEEHFRSLERDAVKRALQEHEGILSLGGGAVMAPETRAMLKGHRVVLLSVKLADGAKRVGFSQARPLLALNPRATLAKMLEERLPYYLEVATKQVETDGKTPEQVADEVLA